MHPCGVEVVILDECIAFVNGDTSGGMNDRVQKCVWGIAWVGACASMYGVSTVVAALQ